MVCAIECAITSSYYNRNYMYVQQRSFISGAPVARVVSLMQDTSNDTFTLVCVTTDSPPTNLLWTKDDVPLSINGTTHTLTQTILDRRRSTYKNVLVIEDSVDRLPGEYSCAVSNLFGTSDKEIITGNG